MSEQYTLEAMIADELAELRADLDDGIIERGSPEYDARLAVIAILEERHTVTDYLQEVEDAEVDQPTSAAPPRVLTAVRHRRSPGAPRLRLGRRPSTEEWIVSTVLAVGAWATLLLLGG